MRWSILSNFFFGTGENLIAAFLPEIAQGEAMGRVSGWGWSLGYFGGIVALGACLAYVTHAQAQGAPASEFVPVTMLITAGIFALASLPTFLFLRERAVPSRRRRGYPAQRVRASRRKRSAMRAALRTCGVFWSALVFYQAGIQTVIALAAIYAQEAMGFTTRDTLFLILVVNVTAAAGAFAFGHVQDRLGHVRTLVITLIGWLIAVVLAWMAERRDACSGSSPTWSGSASAPASRRAARWSAT